jgi:hypothetical protein
MLRKCVILGLLALLLTAAGPAPTGSFTITWNGRIGTVALQDIKGATSKDETTVGTWCFRADGTQIPMGNEGNPYIFEINWFGHFDRLGTVTIPDDAANCTSQLIVAEWFKGQVIQSWVLHTVSYPCGVACG